MQIGAQLYTVRAFTKTLEDFAETLKKVADIGYKVVQVSGTCPYEPEWLDEQLKKNGLICPITHTKFGRMLAEPETVMAEHRVFGCDILGIGGAAYETLMEVLPSFLPKIEAGGFRFSLHNHREEFAKIDGKLFIDRIAEAFPSVLFTIDTYWAQAGGADPVAVLKKFAGRVPCIHYKDMGFNGDDVFMAPIFEGNMNYEAILEASVEAGTKYAFIEQDNCNGEDPFDCLRRSLRNCEAYGYHA